MRRGVELLMHSSGLIVKVKRGIARAVAHLYLKAQTIYLLTIHEKLEKSDLNPNELNEIIESKQFPESQINPRLKYFFGFGKLMFPMMLTFA